MEDLNPETRGNIIDQLKNMKIGHSSAESCVSILDSRLELARNKILSYLDIWRMMDLRLVCKATNEWVEHCHFNKLVLCIKSHAQMERILRMDSAFSWQNVKILCDSEMHNVNWIQNPLYMKILEKFAPSLVKLTLQDHRVPFLGLLSILSTCEVLESLDIGILDCKESNKELLDTEEVKTSLQKIKHLSIGYLSWINEEDLDIFGSLMQRCPNLVTLKAPHILMASLFKIGDTDDEDTDKIYLELVQRKMVNPLVEYLKTRNSSKEKSRQKMTHLDVENLHHTEIFPQLATACNETKTALLNVSEAYESPVPAIEKHLAESIESLNGFTNLIDFNKLINLKSITLDSETSADSAVGVKGINAKLPKLQRLELCLPEDIDESILKCLLKQPRTTVNSLKIEFQVCDPKLATLFQVADLVNNFSNLKQLSLIEWEGKDEDLGKILSGLKNLQELRLQKCFKITDLGFLGSNSETPGLLELKHLKKLWMDCKVSDDVLKKAVSQMFLEELFFSSEKITASGLKYLVEGPLKNSLIVFHGSQPTDCSDEQFDGLLKGFKNLKRRPEHFY